MANSGGGHLEIDFFAIFRKRGSKGCPNGGGAQLVGCLGSLWDPGELSGGQYECQMEHG